MAGATSPWTGQVAGPGENGQTVKGTEKQKPMLYTLAVILILLWLLGFVSSYTMGGVIHILLVIALIMVLVNLISGRRPF
jgi:hypothetical protein